MVLSVSFEYEIGEIERMWQSDRREQVFGGHFLRTVSLRNIRGLSAIIRFDWPVTVIGGPNGSGKSTVLCVCSTAYGRRRKIGSRVSRTFTRGETHPLQPNSEIAFEYLGGGSFRAVRQHSNNRWICSGNRPRRKLLNVDFFTYPVTRPRHSLVMPDEDESKDISIDILRRLSQVLGNTYESGKLSRVYKHKTRGSVKLRQLRRGDHVYCEHHMGAGERKVLDMMLALENIPERALVLLEEPENNLHPDAQRGMAWYLLNVCRRRRHQILLSTHSSEIFEALPQRARILVTRVGSDVEVMQNASCLRTTWELSGTIKTNKPLILVEDAIAKYFLQEILRRYRVELFEGTAVVPVGSARDLRELVLSFRENEVCCIGVRDADMGESVEEGLLSLPGDGSPEAVLLAQSNLDRAEYYVSGIQIVFERAKASGLGYQSDSTRCKQMFESLAAQLQIEAQQLVSWLVLAWLSDSNNDIEARSLVERLQGLLEAQ